jgi:hypothetical protein
MICFLIVSERRCVRAERRSGERRRGKRKKRGSTKKGGTETHGAKSFDSSAARPLSLYIFSCLVVYVLYGRERERLGYTDSSLVHPPIHTHTVVCYRDGYALMSSWSSMIRFPPLCRIGRLSSSPLCAPDSSRFSVPGISSIQHHAFASKQLRLVHPAHSKFVFGDEKLNSKFLIWWCIETWDSAGRSTAGRS